MGEATEETDTKLMSMTAENDGGALCNKHEEEEDGFDFLLDCESAQGESVARGTLYQTAAPSSTRACLYRRGLLTDRC